MFYSLKIKEIVKLTSDCVMIQLDASALDKSIFSFQAGQYITIKAIVNNKEIRRSYSICSDPSEGKLCIGVKKVDDGVFSSYANEYLKVGDLLDVMPPQGNFLLPKDINRFDHFVFYAVGSGITPIISLIKTILFFHPTKTVALYYGNKNTESIIFREEIEGLKNMYVDRFSVNYILSKEVLSSALFYGRINEEKCRIFENKLNTNLQNSCYYICGPNAMIFELKSTLTSLGVDPAHIHFELFNTDGIEREKKNQTVSTDGVKVKVTLDGLEYSYIYDSNQENILDASIQNGIDLPYACKGGVCSTCKARIEKGSVDMYLNYSLEKEEMERGYILTCQAFPISEEVSINFD